MLLRWSLILLLVSPALSLASPPAYPQTASDPAGEQTRPDVPLSAEEVKLQGRWQAYALDSQQELYAFEFSGRTFTARAGEDDWYEGHIVIRNDSEPAQLDFAIDDCQCGYKGESSQAIYRWQGDVLEVAAPAPGDPRPREFEASSGQMMRLLRSEP